MIDSIGNIFTIEKGQKAIQIFITPEDGRYRYIQIEDLRPNSDNRYINQNAGAHASKYDILIAWDGANAGTVGWGLEGYAGSTIAILKPIIYKETFTPYYGYFLQSKFKEIQEHTAGATIPHINRNFLESLTVEKPKYEEQKQIAEILGKADRLRQLHVFARKMSDTYLQSVFIEFFGDPEKNPMGWEFSPLGKLGKLDRGKSKNRPRNAPELYGGKYPFIQTGDVANAHRYIREYHQTYSDLGLKQSKLWPSGTMCITIAANIAKAAILSFDGCFPDSIVGFIPNEKTNTEFIQCWFSFVQRKLENDAPESAQKNINLEILRNLEVISPPKPMQEQFARIVQQTEHLQNQQREVSKTADYDPLKIILTANIDPP
jgi:type I restriction enzyme S subunit